MRNIFRKKDKDKVKPRYRLWRDMWCLSADVAKPAGMLPGQIVRVLDSRQLVRYNKFDDIY